MNSQPSRTTTEILSHSRSSIQKVNPRFIGRPFAVVGLRATTCWLVEDYQDGKRYLIKDCWQAEERNNESFFLEQAVGLERVGQIYAYRNSIYTMSCSTSASSASEAGSPTPRELDCIVSQVYSDHLGTCESVDELVDVIRDISVGE